MQETSVLEAKTHLSRLLAAVEHTGVTVVITRHGRPVAHLVPVPPAPNPTEVLAQARRQAREAQVTYDWTQVNRPSAGEGWGDNDAWKADQT